MKSTFLSCFFVVGSTWLLIFQNEYQKQTKRNTQNYDQSKGSKKGTPSTSTFLLEKPWWCSGTDFPSKQSLNFTCRHFCLYYVLTNVLTYNVLHITSSCWPKFLLRPDLMVLRSVFYNGFRLPPLFCLIADIYISIWICLDLPKILPVLSHNPQASWLHSRVGYESSPPRWYLIRGLKIGCNKKYEN